MAGLAPLNLRQPIPDAPELGEDIIVEIADEAPDISEVDENGAVLKIEHGDGSVTVSLDGRPLSEPDQKRDDGEWFSNLVDDIDQMELGRISEELLRGIDEDISSRKDWSESIATGIQLLGLKIEVPGLQGASDGAPVEGMSKVRHPMLLEAVLRFQANARSELLPTDGPVKVRDDGIGSELIDDRIADALEDDLNHYLTSVATEYYPDTDRMLLMLGFAGIAFKKVYFCPLRMRPVSETVHADDLIVNNSATDLANAQRVTHKVMMRPSTVKRLQILGVYRDVDLSAPLSPSLDSVQREEKAQQGISPETNNPEDRDREIYECYCELAIKGFEHKWKGKPSGLSIPYRVTIDLSSRQILSIVRNYDDSDGLPEARKTFVAYVFVPGFGFYSIGLLHILGNATNALTAAWRIMLDNGMYANFPGFLVSKSGSRQNTNIFRVPPGGGAQVDTGGLPISDAIMPLPYKTEGMAALMALTTSMEQDGQRLGGTSELQVGEGRPDAPVGTTLAMIEQATKIMNSVHKRMHAAQAEEFKLLVECFREHPESFWQHGCASKTQWTEEMFLAALDDCDLVPQADPNTASHAQRVMKIMGLKQLQAASPTLYNPLAVDMAALQALGWNNPEQFLATPQQQAQPPADVLEKMAKAKVDQQLADAKTQEVGAKVAETQAKIQQAGSESTQQTDTPVDVMQAKTKAADTEIKRQELGLKGRELQLENQNRDLDRASKEKLAFMELARDVMEHPQEAAEGAKEVKPIEREIGV